MEQEIAAEQLRQLENEDEMNNTGVIMIAPVLEEEEEDEDYLESTTETD